MRRRETVDEAARRGVLALEHLLICADMARVFGPAALAGDPDAAQVIRAAADHMRSLGGNRHG